eukprot:GFUD01030482.1.p1 GENE.GFUD01030482.1~~GFUD01030482.1.p1  ORF type:complete len:698 (+),score=201.77 GFUD01030482.1:315-2096(+)
MVKQWGETVRGLRDWVGDKNWEKGVQDAEKVVTLSNEERLETLLVDHLPSDEEWSDKEVSFGSKWNEDKVEGMESNKRILMMDSDDSDEDPEFKPSKKELKAVEEAVSDDSDSEQEQSSDDGAISPGKGSKKRTMEKRLQPVVKKSKLTSMTSPPQQKSLSTPVGKFTSNLTLTSSSPSSLIKNKLKINTNAMTSSVSSVPTSSSTDFNCNFDMTRPVSMAMQEEIKSQEEFTTPCSSTRQEVNTDSTEAEIHSNIDQRSSTEMIPGFSLDFRCTICQMVQLNRSELYRHYAQKHFREQLRKEFGHLNICPYCNIDLSKITSACHASHFGQKHDMVEKFLPAEAKIPRGLGRRMASTVAKPLKCHQLASPSVPLHYGITAMTRPVNQQDLPAGLNGERPVKSQIPGMTRQPARPLPRAGTSGREMIPPRTGLPRNPAAFPNKLGGPGPRVPLPAAGPSDCSVYPECFRSPLDFPSQFSSSIVELDGSLTRSNPAHPTSPSGSVLNRLTSLGAPVAREKGPSTKHGWIAPPGLNVIQTTSSREEGPSLTLPCLAKALLQLGERSGRKRFVQFKLTEDQVRALDALGVKEEEIYL